MTLIFIFSKCVSKSTNQVAQPIPQINIIWSKRCKTTQDRCGTIKVTDQVAVTVSVLIPLQLKVYQKLKILHS